MRVRRKALSAAGARTTDAQHCERSSGKCSFLDRARAILIADQPVYSQLGIIRQNHARRLAGVFRISRLLFSAEKDREAGDSGATRSSGDVPPPVGHCVLRWPLPLSVRASMRATDRGEGHDLVIVLFDFPTLFHPWLARLRPKVSAMEEAGQQGEAPRLHEDGARVFFWLPPPPPRSPARMQRVFH